MANYPEIKYSQRGNTYNIEFEIDQRKCNIFILVSIFFNHYNDKSKGFKVLDFKSMSQGEIITWYIDF